MSKTHVTESLPKLYTDLAAWWHVLSVPEDYAEEAEFYRQVIVSACASPPKTLLELGCGGGNNASHLKQHFQMTLVDRSAGMLAASHRLNPECEHIEGDMRSIRLDRTFEAVFIHDAIVYMTTERDLQAAIETAFVHCKLGGAALFAPDYTRETFRPSTSHGGHDRNGRSLRYLEWMRDPDPGDTTYVSDMVYLFCEQGREMRCEYDRHVCGLFSHHDWMRIITKVGFQAQSVPFEHSEFEPGSCEVFLGVKL
ncbi:MAG: class I SAM-dependent methyltransferase [Chloroflexota bacterium]